MESEAAAWPWGDLAAVTTAMAVPAGYRVERARRDEIASLVTSLAAWYPDIATGAESVHLEPSFYDEEASFLDGGREPILPIVFRHGDELAGMMTLEKHDRARNVTSRMGAIAPRHRKAGLGYLGPWILEGMARAMGAGLAYYVATLKVPYQQVVAEKVGFSLVGILPAFDRDTVRPGEVRRVYEAIYAKVLAPHEAIEAPDRAAMTPATQRLFDTLFAPGMG